MRRLRNMLQAVLLPISLLAATFFLAAAQAPFGADTPRHDAQLVAKSRFPLVTPGEPYAFSFTLANSGYQTWLSDGSYRLQRAKGELPGIGSEYPLARPLAPGERVIYQFEGVAPQAPGLYRADWQLAYRETSGVSDVFGPVVSSLVVVVPSRTLGGSLTVAGYLLQDYARQAALAAGQAAEGLLQALEARLVQEGQAQAPAEVACLQGLVAVGLIVSGPAWWRRREQDEDR